MRYPPSSFGATLWICAPLRGGGRHLNCCASCIIMRKLGFPGTPPLPAKTRKLRFRAHYVLVDAALAPVRIETSLSKSDIRSLFPMAFHGTRAADLRFLENGGRFTGHWSFFDPAPVANASGKPFLESFFNALGLVEAHGFPVSTSIQTATGMATKAFEANGMTSLAEGDTPVIIVTKGKHDGTPDTDPSYLGVRNQDVEMIVRPEMDKVVEEALMVPAESVVGRAMTFYRNTVQVLAQGLVNGLEAIAKREVSETSKDGLSFP